MSNQYAEKIDSKNNHSRRLDLKEILKKEKKLENINNKNRMWFYE